MTALVRGCQQFPDQGAHRGHLDEEAVVAVRAAHHPQRDAEGDPEVGEGRRGRKARLEAELGAHPGGVHPPTVGQERELLGREVRHPGTAQHRAEATDGHPGIATIYAPTTATPRELLTSIEPVVRPTLSPREREVLNELARGATYADIAANLFVSENTIKTHVSSLYGKLSVSRRSEALAVARNLHLL